MSWLYGAPKLRWFLFLTGATLFFVWLPQTFFVLDILYYNTYGDRLSIDTIERLIGNADRYAWLAYVAAPLLLLLRVTLVACCLYAALFFKNEKPGFAACFNISLKADTVFVLLGLVNIVYHLAVPFSNLAELSANPLTLLYYMDVENVPKYLLYPLGLVNLAELFYWGGLTGLACYRFRFPAGEGLAFVVQSYGTGLLLMAMIFALILM